MIGIIIALWRFFASRLKSREQLEAENVALRQQLSLANSEPRSGRDAGALPNVERLIGSIRRECLDHLIILNGAHLRRVLRAYANYYNRSRTHLSLDKDTPLSRPILQEGRI